MHVNYEWRGPEKPLGSSLVTAKHMSIQEIEDDGTTLFAKGKFTFYDHVEGCDSEDPWIATVIFAEGKLKWAVRRQDPQPKEFVFTSKSGEPLFTLSDKINVAIKVFIADKLTWIVEHIRDNPDKNIVLVDQPKQYEGPKHEYTGQCLCLKILLSKTTDPFDWNKYTNGGKYPANCFECSCGKQWFRYSPEEEVWLQVGDPETWFMLTHFNGVVMESIGLDPESTIPLLVLTRTLRERGFIQIG